MAQVSGTREKEMGKLIDEQFSFAAKQYKLLSKNVPADRMPKTFNTKSNKVETSNTKWWCSGFFCLFSYFSILCVLIDIQQ